jgi:hypothetical protein
VPDLEEAVVDQVSAGPVVAGCRDAKYKLVANPKMLKADDSVAGPDR